MMTEVVTSFAAPQQLNLLASRQQGFGVSASEVASAAPAPTAPTNASNALQSVLAAADKSGAEESASETAQRDAETGAPSGPSRPRIQIKQFDVGLSPSEVVGTPDVLQRFDQNGDGRVDLLESDKATLVRQKVTTFAGLAATAPRKGAVEIGFSVAEPPGPPLTEEEAPKLAREVGIALAGLENAGLPKKFAEAAEQLPGTKKYRDAAQVVAELGVPNGDADAPKKYYGQGAEVVAGQVTNGTSPPVKYADRAPLKDFAGAEEGTGETKYYDRVAQSETSDGSGDPNAKGESYHEKAAEIASALHGKKTAPVVAAYTTSEVATDAAQTVVVTA